MSDDALPDSHRRQAERNAEKVARVAPADPLTPADRYQELFVAVQTARVFADSKTFVDCAPRQPPEAILAAYRAQCDAPGFDLAAFVHAHFRLRASAGKLLRLGSRSRPSSRTSTACGTC